MIACGIREPQPLPVGNDLAPLITRSLASLALADREDGHIDALKQLAQRPRKVQEDEDDAPLLFGAVLLLAKHALQVLCGFSPSTPCKYTRITCAAGRIPTVVRSHAKVSAVCRPWVLPERTASWRA